MSIHILPPVLIPSFQLGNFILRLPECKGQFIESRICAALRGGEVAGAAAGTRGKVGTVIGVEGGFVVLESGLAESLVGFGLEKLDLGFFGLDFFGVFPDFRLKKVEIL